MMPFGTSRPPPPGPDRLPTGTLAVEVIPPRVGRRAFTDIESVMQALVSAVGHPVALDLVGTTDARRFLVRATSTADLARVVAQLRARYPQAAFHPLDAGNDPLRIDPGEAISALELRPGAASYLPLRIWKERDLEHEGADPLLGQLAALAEVPDGMRAIAQLALVALPERWSKRQQRYAVEHPLAREQQRERLQMAQSRYGNVSLAPVFLLGLVIIGLLLVLRFQAALPLWMRQDMGNLVRGKAVHLTPAQQWMLWLWGIGGVLVVCAVLFGVAWIKRQFHRTPLYDQQLAREKTARLAYRVRVRIMIIGPRWASPPPPRAALVPAHLAAQQEVPYLHAAFAAQRAAARRRWRRHWTHVSQHAAFRRRIPRLLWRVLCWRWTALMAWWQDRWRLFCDARHQTAQRWEAAATLVGAYRQFHQATGAFFVPRRIWGRWVRHLLTRQKWSFGVARSQHLLSVADVAALWHLPQGEDLPDLGQVARTRARTRLVPAKLSGNGYPLGVSTHAGRTMPVTFPPSALQRNLLAVAKSGKGKSTLFLALAQAALADANSGLFVLDPHGDLVDDLLGLIPIERAAEVHLVDLAERATPVGINPLDVTAFPDRDLVVSHLISIFTHIWERTWGSRMEAAFEIACKTLYEVNRALVAANPQQGPDQQLTLLDVGPVLSVQPFRLSLIDLVGDPIVRAWWSEFYEPKTARDKQDMISPVLTKMNKFAASLTARRIVGQPHTTVDVAQATRAGRIVLVRTAKGTVGEDVAAILGAMLVGLAGATMLASAHLPRESRQRTRFIIDEFQTLPGVSWGAFLSELRKYQGSFALATQALSHLDKLDPELRPTVFANIEQFFSFNVSADDARIIEWELDSVVESDDLTNLDDFEAYVKSTVDGQRQSVFSLRLNSPAHSDRDLAARLKAGCQFRFGVPATRVDEMVDLALRRHLHFTEEAYAAEQRRAAKKAAAAARATVAKASGNTPSPSPTACPIAPLLAQESAGQGSEPIAVSPMPGVPAPPAHKPTRRSSGTSQQWSGAKPDIVQVPLLGEDPGAAEGGGGC